MCLLPRRMNVLAALGVAAALSGCVGAAPDLADFDAQLRYPVRAEAAMATLSLQAPTAGSATTADDWSRLDRFVADYEKRGEGTVDVLVTAASADDREAADWARTLAAELVRRGVPSERMSVRLLPGEAGSSRTAVMTYRQYVARVPECGQFPSSFNSNWDNSLSPNHGCAISRNMGLMISNPRDLERQRTADEVDAVRSADVVGKYRRGEATVSAGKVETTVISGPR